MTRRDQRIAQGEKPPSITEQQFQALVIDLATRLGYDVYHTQDSRRSSAGYPDLTIAGHHLALVAELKSATGRVTPAQRRWLDLLSAGGWACYVWRPDDLGEIQRVLEKNRDAWRQPRSPWRKPTTRAS